MCQVYEIISHILSIMTFLVMHCHKTKPQINNQSIMKKIIFAELFWYAYENALKDFKMYTLYKHNLFIDMPCCAGTVHLSAQFGWE